MRFSFGFPMHGGVEYPGVLQAGKVEITSNGWGPAKVSAAWNVIDRVVTKDPEVVKLIRGMPMEKVANGRLAAVNYENHPHSVRFHPASPARSRRWSG